MLTESVSELPADEKARLSILLDLRHMQRKRGYFVRRGDTETNYCDDCVRAMVAKSQPWGKK